MSAKFDDSIQVLEKKSDILKAIAHPVRLCIVKGLLMNNGCNVTHIQNCLNIPQSTISQHISKLRAAGIIKGERNGLEITYSVIDEDTKKIIAAIFE